MPNYAFKCENCDHTFDEILSLSERNTPLEKPCPQCKKKKIIKDWQASTPSLAMDATLTPSKVVGSQFKEVIDKIKSSGQVPKRFHERLDRSSDFRNGSVL
jgi:putative FmdB family regulatory protein